ncbi:MAG TPA: gamma-glutamyl-gamma-aminobutyrate hydrolase family protein [Syntrophomonadaceae bacterium]|nr:gamma-glutamyl-gamma-aminobutyrate hydrolase family protein [Syntrophomonadaceae bacterium]
MVKPIIGLTTSYEEEEGQFQLRDHYVRAIETGGGLPVILPIAREELIASYLDCCSALLFSGGGDIDPVHWGQIPGADMGWIDPQRDHFELLLARYAYQRGIPALGICRGCQVLNVAAGGSLFQNLDSDLCHQQNAPRNYAIHDIVMMEGSLLEGILGQHSLRVNSFHHQAVHETGTGLIASAWAVDGVVEAIESDKHPFWLGVQWHPECLPDQASVRLFRSLVQAAYQHWEADNASRLR